MKPNNIDIIHLLRNNARESLTNMSKKSRIPISTIYDFIKNTDIIDRHTSIIDYPKLNYHVSIKWVVLIPKNLKIGFIEWLCSQFCMNSIYLTNNKYSYICELIFKNIKEMENFLEIGRDKFKIELDEIFYLIEPIKRESFLNNKNLLSLNGEYK